jgi:hypothetical protein
MSKSRVDSKHEGKPNNLQQDTRQQRGRRNLGQPTQLDFAKQLTQHLNALKQTFNEAKETSHPLPKRNGTVDKELKEIQPRKDSISRNADENTRNKDTCNSTNDSTELEGRCAKEKRTYSNVSSDNQRQDTAQTKRSRTLPSSIS